MTRDIRSQSWCWQSKETLRHITEHVDRKQLPSVRNVYMTLTQLASDSGSDSIDTFLMDIARVSGLGEKTISKSLEILQELGFVVFKPQERGLAGKYEKREISLVDHVSTARNLEESSGKVRGKLELEVTDIKKKETNKEIKKQYNDHFNTFWGKYPKKTGKKTCEQKYSKIYNQHDDIIDGLDKYVEYWQSKDTPKEYIPNPLTWLNQERWNDEIEKPREENIFN